jgi:hypothetical protein
MVYNVTVLDKGNVESLLKRWLREAASRSRDLQEVKAGSYGVLGFLVVTAQGCVSQEERFPADRENEWTNEEFASRGSVIDKRTTNEPVRKSKRPVNRRSDFGLGLIRVCLLKC